MYNQESINTLIRRIGWAEAMPPSTVEVSDENKETESGRYFNGFNQLATVENVNASITNKDADNDTLNEFLAEMRKDGVMDVLTKVYNLNTRATASETNGIISLNYALDYSSSIDVNRRSFDDAIGLSVSIKALELLKTTNRSNRTTTNPNIDSREVLEFLHGAFAPTGKVITEGLYAQYRESIGKLIDVLFPVKYPDGSEVVVDPDGGVTVTTKPKPTLTGRRVW